MKYLIVFTFASLCAMNTLAQGDKSSTTLLLAEDIQWSPLNPARGDNSPQAGTLWGDRNSTDPTGFLVEFKEGFSSPAHIHNVTYKGIVISGLVHNDDPNAESMWMPAGSFWTQPAGEGHITAAKGKKNVAFIEIEEGPYLVKPTDQAFDNGERPVNVDQSNIVWLDASNIKWIDQNSDGVKVAFLWGKPANDELNGSLIKLPAGFNGEILSSGGSLKAVVIQGSPQYRTKKKNQTIAPGSYFGSKGKTSHQISSQDESTIYVRTIGQYEIIKN
ncbi:MAG: DUF4437 domain-containing protein [Reichenbachiella sp.]|uniref:DUF4437 domain-containing protein n=1 Tax=Reichenbachiella sp. TaxID=2184521 RepID=UPI003297D6BB